MGGRTRALAAITTGIVGRRRAEIDEVGSPYQFGDLGIAAAPGKQRRIQRLEQVDVLFAPTANWADGVAVVGMKHRGKAGEHFNIFFIHHIGLVQPPLRTGLGVIVDFDRECRAGDQRADRQTRQRSQNWRNRRGRGRLDGGGWCDGGGHIARAGRPAATCSEGNYGE